MKLKKKIPLNFSKNIRKNFYEAHMSADTSFRITCKKMQV